MPIPFNITGHLQVALAMIIVGSSIVAGKIISTEMPVFLASFIRFFVAAIFIIPLNRIMSGELSVPKISELKLLGIQAFFGVFLFSVCLFFGLTRTSAVNAGVILGMLPAVTAVLSILILKEQLNLNYVLGIGFSVLGAIMLESRNAEISSFGVGVIGLLFIFGAIVCEGLFSVIGKLSGLTLSPITITTWVTIIGVVLFAPFAILDGLNFNFSTISLRTWLCLLYYSVVVTVLGFSLFYAGLSKISALSAGVHMAWAPLSAMVIAVLFLGEPVGLFDLISGICVITAVLIISLGGKKEAIFDREVLFATDVENNDA